MATPRDPHSASPASGPDDDISLEEPGDRQAPRAPLPVQRKEKRQFEMAGHAPAASSESAAPAPLPAAPAPHDWVPVPADEIENYDPAAPAEAPAPSGTAPRRASEEEQKVILPATAGLDDLEEFIARTVASGPASDAPPRERRPFSRVEKICTAGGLVLLLGLLGWLFSAAAREDNSVASVSQPHPDLPITGALLTLTDVRADWRKRLETDRTEQMDVMLPVPAQQMPEVLPQVSFTIAPSGSGFLRFVFSDATINPQTGNAVTVGDPRIVEIKDGKIVNMNNGGSSTSPASGNVYCSGGLASESTWRSYCYENAPRWYVTVAESASYGAADKDWKVLATFDVLNELAP